MTITKDSEPATAAEPEINVAAVPEEYPIATPVNDVPTTPTSPQSPPKPTVIPAATVPHHAGSPHVISPQYVHISSRNPVVITYCPRCAREQCQTQTRTKSTGTTWVCVLVGVFVFWPLCWVPLAVKQMKQTNHYCKACGAKVGRVKPFH